MEKQKNEQLWAASLMVIGVATLVIAGAEIFGAELSDAARRVLGIAELLALPVLVFTTARKLRRRG